jgi:hypothetical protein
VPLAWVLLVVLALLAAMATHAIAAPGELDGSDDDLQRNAHDDDRVVGAESDIASGLATPWLAEPWARRAGPCNCAHDVLARVVARAPALSAIVAAAQRAAGLRGDPVPGWRRRSRLAAIVPTVSLRGGNSESWRDVTDPTINRAAAFGATLAWRLERLVFDPNEPRFTAYEIARRRERRRVAQATVRTYTAWLEAVAAAERDAGWQLQLLQTEADLDALTDGWFSENLTKVSESR